MSALLFPLPKRTTVPASKTNYYIGRTRAIRVIVLHSMEAQESADTAEAVGRWFQNPAANGSTQVGVDSDSICRYVGDEHTVWGAKGVNADGLHIEQAGYARQTAAQWRDNYSLRTIENAAIIGAEWAIKYKIPVRWLTIAQIRDGKTKGFMTHHDSTIAFSVRGGHTDPGAAYPRGYYLERVAFHVKRLTSPTNPAPATPKPTPVPVIEKKVSLTVDGVMGPATRRRWQEIMRKQGYSSVVVDGVISRPSRLVRAVQEHLNSKGAKLVVDGLGIQSNAGGRYPSSGSTETLRAAQRYAGTSPDGYLSKPSAWVRWLQRRLNEGKF